MNAIDEFLAEVRGKGVHVWVDGDDLRCRAPKGRLTPELRQEIARRKGEILQALGSADAELSATNGHIPPVPRDGDLPLSSAQRRLWFLDQYESNTSIYNVNLALRLRGVLRTDVLRDSLDQIVRRHEILRTVFPAIDGRPVQRILPGRGADVTVLDLEATDPDQRAERARVLLAEEASRPFDLSVGPLFRVVLLRLAAEDHFLLLTMHHIVSDAWSIGVLIREFSELYTASCAGCAPALPALRIQYADYAAWQSEHARDGRSQEQLEYWKRQLSGAPPLLELPWDRPRPATQTHRGRAETFQFSEALTARLNDIGREAGVSLFMTLLAGFSALLARYSGQEDLVVGSPIANRTRREIEPLIGFFVNTLVMRTDLSGDPSFRELLTRVKRVALDAYAHQDLPFEELVEQLQPARSTSYAPFFQVMLAVQNAPISDLELPGLTAELVPLDHETAKFDLILVFKDDSLRLGGSLEYNTDLFEPETIRRMLRHLAALFEGAVADPDRPVLAIPLLSPDERHRQLVAWNDSARPYPQEPIAQLFKKQVEATPEAIAVEFLGQRLTYRELDGRTDRLACFLQEAGVGPGVAVGLCTGRSLEMIVGLLGILKAGGAYVPLAPELPEERLEWLIADAGAALVLTQEHLASRLPRRRPRTIRLDAEWERLAPYDGREPRAVATIDDLAYVMYTSGSTGLPKGVAVPQRGVVRLVRNTNFVHLGPDVIALNYAPLSFDASTLEIWGPLLNGGRVVLMPPHQLSIEELAEAIRSRGINTIWLTSGLFHLLVDHRIDAFEHVRESLAGGDVLSPTHVARVLERYPTCTVINGYGPTENTTLTTYHRITSRSGFDHAVPIGRPISNTTVYILDRRMEPVPIGVAGELYTGGHGLALGYVNDARLTAEKFVPDPFAADPPGRLYRTGDQARYRADGTIEFLGRIDLQVKLRGFRIEPGEIEATLSRHPEVLDVVVTVREDEPGDKRLVCYAVPASPDLTSGDLREFLRSKLPDYMVPSAFVLRETLPLTHNGKVDRRALPAPEWSCVESEAGAAPPRTPIEELVAGIWGGVLGVAAVGIHHNFFDLGGHSLLATQAVSRIREALQVDLPLRDLFEAPTVAGLAERIEARRAERDARQLPPILPRTQDGPLPLSHAQERLWFLQQLEPANPFYNIPVAFRCTGTLDIDALGRFLNELVRRHASLRTTFVELDGRPFQRVHPHLDVTIDRQSLHHIDAERRDEEVRRLALAEALKPFRLETGPLVRATLLELDAQDHVLLLTLHHIVADGWSLGILVREFGAIYPALARGEDSPLPDLEIQYADFAVWQREWLRGERLQAELEFWTGQLAGAPRVLEPPADHPRPPVQTYRGGARPFLLPADATSRLKALSQDAGASLFMTLFAGFATLIHRLTGEDDFLIGSPIANRHHQAIEPLIGFFVNTLALRADLSGDPEFPELLKRVRRMTLDAFAHQDVPFETLVERLQPRRDMSRNPLVQVSFIFQNAPFSVAELEGLTLRQIHTETGTARFDLEVFLWEHDGGLRGVFAYYTDLFEEPTIARLVHQFETLLTGIATEPHRRVSALPILTDEELRALLVVWNATAAEYPRERCVHKLFEEQAARLPDAIAVVDRQESLTYAQLDARANQLARHLQDRGAGPEVLVGLCLERSIDLVVAILGIMKSGAAYVPLDANYPQGRLAFIIEDARLSLLLTQSTLEKRLPFHGARTLFLDTAWDRIAHESPTRPSSAVGPENLVYVIYTSGSTGRPKGTLLEHRGVVNYLAWARRAYDVAAGSGAPVNTSIGFDATVTSLLTPLVAGRRVLLLPEDGEIEHLAALLQEPHDFSLVKLTPAHLELLARLLPPRPVTGQARAFVIGGEALTAAYLAFWRQYAPGVRLINEYGPTETVVGCCVYEMPPGAPLRDNVPIGRPIANTRLYVLDRHGAPVPVGVPGELYIGGAGVGRGYLNRAELTAERFLRDPFAGEPGARMYRTGDQARHLPDGNLEYLGRLDAQIKLRGYRIELGEIERVLAEHPAVDDVVLMARQDEPGDARLVAYVLPDDTRSMPAPEAAAQDEPQREQVTQWEHVFEDSYAGSRTSDNPTFDIAGWNSSFTGEPIPAEEMREWVDQTVGRIRSHRMGRVWEIGCGTGLLLFRLAPEADSYLGTDFSDTALRRIERMARRIEGLGNVRLRRRVADDFSDLPGPFDTIILNSVVQYFPGIDYLLSVLDGAVARLAPGGRIIVGDVRSLPLLEAFHGSVESSRAAEAVAVAELKRRVRQRMSEEEELVIDPEFFVALPARYPGLTHVAVELKRGRHNNELLRFRYDATLHFGPRPRRPSDIVWRDWREEPLPPDLLRALLAAERPEAIALRHVPNARLQDDLHLVQALRSAADAETVRELRRRMAEPGPRGIDPEHYWAIGAELGYRVAIAPSEEPGGFDAIFQRLGREGAVPEPIACAEPVGHPKPWRRYGNNPLRAKLDRRLVPELRRLAEAKLPDYMVPSAFVVVDGFPLTANGKVDLEALPAPDGRGAAAGDDYVPPRTPDEEVLAAIWADVLRLDRVGVHDDFFSLGGHSLLATQVISRVREAFAVELQVRTIFEAPTVAGLAGRVRLLRADDRQAAPPPPLGPQPRGAEVPLSFAQERLWFLDRLEQETAAYSMPTAHRLSGRLDVAALRSGFEAIGRRHEVLRTTFSATADGRPLQVIAPEREFELPVTDLVHLDDEAKWAEVRRLCAAEYQRRFDLERGPLWRATVLRLGDDDHILLTSTHHIISDGWSMGVLIRELAELYEAATEGRPPRLAPLPLQYADYAIWQRDWLTGDVLQAQLDYWKTHLHGAPPLLELPTDHPRPAVQGFHGRVERFELDPALSQALEDLGRRQGVSLYMTLLAAFATLLSRYSRQQDLVIGSPIAGRNRREIEPLIGFFVNTLALQIDLAGDPTFAELLKRVRKVALDAYAHQDIPFEHLVEELRPERNLSHAPVFQVMFVLQNTPSERIDLPGMTLTPVEAEMDTAKFDLTLCMGADQRTLWGWVEYRMDLFEAPTIRRLIGHFQNLLRVAVADPTARAGLLPMLGAGERRQVLHDWNQTRTDDGVTRVDRRFEAQVRASPERVAVELGEESLTYRALNQRANRLAHHLRRLGIALGSRVGICMDRSVEMVVSVLAVLKAGGAYVPLDPHYPSERLNFMLADAGVDVLLTQSHLGPSLPPHHARVIPVDVATAVLDAEGTGDPDVPIDPEDLAYIIYTSGSTGQPKGVAMTHRALANLIRWQVEDVPGFAAARTLQFTSLSFDVSFQEIFSAWCSGGTLVLVDDPTRRDSRALVRFLQEREIERIFLPFVALQELALSALDLDVGSLPLREIITAGEQLRVTPELAELLRRLPECRLHNHYGPAESHVVTAFTLPEDIATLPELPPIGRPITNAEIYILDEHLQPVPVGVPGELFVGGDCLARGYWNRPGLTAQRFIPDPFGTRGEARLYRTGDLARFLGDGTIEFLGRCDDQVKIRGFRVEPGEVEAVLARSPDVAGVAVVARDDRPGNRRLVAYVVPRPGAHPLEADLRDLVRASLPEFMVPSSFVVLEAFPLTPSSKVNRRALPAPESVGTASTGYVAPRDPYELRLSAIWEAVLDRRPIGVKEDFFDLGGHSLLAVRLMARVEREFGIDLPLSVLFQDATVERLARHLRDPSRAEAPTCLVPLQPHGTRPPFFCVPGAGGNVFYLCELARRLGPDQPFYGLQAIGLDGATRVASRIEDMAARYIGAIRAVQPQGPYYLGGHSFGGQVAYEIARQLQHEGHEVGLLVIFDTNAPQTIERPAGIDPDDDARWLCEIATVIEHLSGRKQDVSYDALRTMGPAQQLAEFRAKLIRGGWLPAETTPTQLRTFVEVYKANIRVVYRPEDPLPTRIALFKAQDPMTTAPPDAREEPEGVPSSAWGWNELADGAVEVYLTPGHHLTMMTEPHVTALAGTLRACLNNHQGALC